MDMVSRTQLGMLELAGGIELMGVDSDGKSSRVELLWVDSDGKSSRANVAPSTSRASIRFII